MQNAPQSGSILSGATLRGFLLLLFDLDALFLDVEPEPAEEAHIQVGYPHQCKAGDQVSAPIVIQKFVARDHQE